MTQGPDGSRRVARHEIAGAAFLFLVLLVGSSAVYVALGEDAGPDATRPVERGMGAQLVGSLLALGVACLWRSRARLRGDGGVLGWVFVYVGFLFVWVPAALGVTMAWHALGLPLAPQPHLAWFTEPHGPLPLAVVGASVCVVGPVTEEVIFRGHLQTGLATLVGPRAAIVWSAVLFGLLHVTSGAVLFVPITLLGLLFGWLRQRTGGLLAPVVVHALHNTLMVVVVSTAPHVLTQLQDR